MKKSTRWVNAISTFLLSIIVTGCENVAKDQVDVLSQYLSFRESLGVALFLFVMLLLCVLLFRSSREKRQLKILLEKHTAELEEQRELTRTEHVKAETSAYWYKSILDATPFPITVTNADMNWTFVNKAVENFLGTKLEDMLGKPCSNWAAHICNTPDCGIACAKRGIKRTYFTHEGASYQVDVEILRGLNGEITGFVEVVQDITKIEEMAKEQANAVAASLAKSKFLANMSHEVRTPLNVILGVTELQLHSETLAPDAREAFGMIYNSVDLLLGIINDILDMSKIEAGKLELVPAMYEVATLINDAAQSNMMRIGSKPIDFLLHVDENTPAVVVGDDLRVSQILNNLLSNAFKYTAQGVVTLSVSCEKGQEETDDVTLVFLVSDTGQGMTTEHVSRLFDEYSRFNQEANRATYGAGLGMGITRDLVHLMHGELSVDSEPGRGTIVTVRLPQGNVNAVPLGPEVVEHLRQFRKNGPAQTTRAHIVREPMPYGSVLVVDDISTNLYVAKGLLASYDLPVDTAQSGFAAIEKIKSGRTYDIVFMDHMMPDQDGIETTKHLRGMGYDRPIVALTANAIAGQADMFLANGFDDFISKPIDIRHLNSILNKLIRDKQQPEVIEAARRQTGKRHGTADEVPSASIAEGTLFLPGLDTEKALNNLGNDEQLYILLLKEFFTSYGTVEEQFYEAIDAGDMNAGRRIAHSLKGTAGTIGATSLASECALLEASFVDSDDIRATRSIAAAAFKTLTSIRETLAQAVASEFSSRH